MLISVEIIVQPYFWWQKIDNLVFAGGINFHQEISRFRSFCFSRMILYSGQYDWKVVFHSTPVVPFCWVDQYIFRLYEHGPSLAFPS